MVAVAQAAQAVAQAAHAPPVLTTQANLDNEILLLLGEIYRSNIFTNHILELWMRRLSILIYVCYRRSN